MATTRAEGAASSSVLSGVKGKAGFYDYAWRCSPSEVPPVGFRCQRPGLSMGYLF